MGPQHNNSSASASHTTLGEPANLKPKERQERLSNHNAASASMDESPGYAGMSHPQVSVPVSLSCLARGEREMEQTGQRLLRGQ